jgi:hypothetical protein
MFLFGSLLFCATICGLISAICVRICIPNRWDNHVPHLVLCLDSK